MKKLFTLVAVASMFTFVACGPSAEEKAAKDKAIADSTKAFEEAAAAEQAAEMARIQDSTKQFEEAAKVQAMNDSIAKYEESKGKKKK